MPELNEKAPPSEAYVAPNSWPVAATSWTRAPRTGRWVVCGYGRLGRELTSDLRAEGLEVLVIDPNRMEFLRFGVGGDR